ncbi:MAG TPA: hypothetical protein VMT03_16070 [Polyangia bacterium]|nr:hypothetical protein [Polyangia bacterium]
MNRKAGLVGGAALALLAGRIARAEAIATAVANVTGGATNNALLAPEGASTLGLDEFTTVRASLQGEYRGRLVDQTLSYVYTGTFYATYTDANGNAHQLIWTLNATPTGRTEVRAQAAATYAHLNSINPLAAAATLNPQVVATSGFVSLPKGSVTYFGGTAQAAASYRPSGTTLWSELTAVNSFVPTAGETGYSVALVQSGHFERQRARNALLVDLTLSYLDASTLAPDGYLPLQPSPMFEAQGTVGWRRDVSPFFFYSIDGGALMLDTTDGSQLTVQPVAQGTIHYQSGTVISELQVSQSSQMNVYLGQTFMAATATARTLVPLDRRERFRVVGLGTASRQWAITSDGLDTAMDLLAADLGIAYQPVQQPFVASLDYSIQDQLGYTVGSNTYPTLHRQVVMLTVTGTWSSDRGAR